MSTFGTQADKTTWRLPLGFRFAGLHCGIRTDASRKDLAVVLSDTPASAPGVFTRNQVRAAPVRVCQERVPSRDIRGIVICSGNANAYTGSWINSAAGRDRPGR